MESIDHTLFQFINGLELSTAIDTMLIYWRKSVIWIPLYIGLLVFLFIRLGVRSGMILGITAIMAVGLSDFSSASLLKPAFERSRPCHQFSAEEINLRITCGSGKSFPSTHASNHMCLAIFLLLSVRLFAKRIKFGWLIPWAILVGFAQIYVGVHFPADVLFGFLWGGIIGYSFYLLIRSYAFPYLKINEN
jgi:membrane-associated phospholipid phosphatase